MLALNYYWDKKGAAIEKQEKAVRKRHKEEAAAAPAAGAATTTKKSKYTTKPFSRTKIRDIMIYLLKYLQKAYNRDYINNEKFKFESTGDTNPFLSPEEPKEEFEEDLEKQVIDVLRNLEYSL